MEAPPKYLSCAETAKLIRAALKAGFPGVRFSVRSETYSMGASIDVSWTDGPRAAAVETITQQFRGADFDGSIDLKTYRKHYLLPDGSVAFASTEGTQGSGGYLPQIEEGAMPSGAVKVRFGADHVFCHRGFSERARAMIQQRAAYWAAFEHDAQRREWEAQTYFHRAAQEFDFCGWLHGGKPTFRPDPLNGSW